MRGESRRIIMSVTSGNFWLNQAQMEGNVSYWWNLVRIKHPEWTKNSQAAMMGNAQLESTVNPGIWQNLTVNYSQGYGLFQWTEARYYIQWATNQGLDPGNMNTAFLRIEYELANHLQYYPTSNYPETFQQFLTSTKDIGYLTRAFVRNYERPAAFNDEKRTRYAMKWYKFLDGAPIPPDIPWNPPDGSFWWIYYMRRRLNDGFY